MIVLASPYLYDSKFLALSWAVAIGDTAVGTGVGAGDGAGVGSGELPDPPKHIMHLLVKTKKATIRALAFLVAFDYTLTKIQNLTTYFLFILEQP